MTTTTEIADKIATEHSLTQSKAIVAAVFAASQQLGHLASKAPSRATASSR